MSIIYQAKNLLNGKIYIGQTVFSLEYRRKSHEDDAQRDKGYLFHRALKKYGFNAFEWSILYEGDFDKDDLDVLERNAIRYLKTTDRSKGYNICEGGIYRPAGWKHTEESKQKQSRKMKGRTPPNLGVPHTLATKEKLRLRALDRSPEVRKRMSEAQIGKNMGQIRIFLAGDIVKNLRKR